jgi:hypothetical protein
MQISIDLSGIPLLPYHPRLSDLGLHGYHKFIQPQNAHTGIINLDYYR